LRAQPPNDRAEFMQRAKTFIESAEARGLQVVAQELGVFGQEGRHRRRFVDAFVSEVFKYEEPATIIPPFTTQFGHHIVWLDRSIPAKNVTFEEAEPALRQGYHLKFLHDELLKFGDELAEQFPAINDGVGSKKLLNPNPLGALSVYE